MEKYQHFNTDTTQFNVTVTPFEVGSHTGQITPENKKSLQLVHKYCLKNIKFSNFIKNISSIVVLSSFHLFHSRNEDSWEKGDPILAPF